MNPLYAKKLRQHEKLNKVVSAPSQRFTASKIRHLNRNIQNRIVYPQVAIRRGWEGKVSIRLEVTAKGKVRRIQVMQSSGYKILDNTVINFISNWLFDKGKKDEFLVLNFAFRLHGEQDYL